MTWWTALYDDLLATILLDPVDDAVTDDTVAFLIDALALGPGDRVFDQCAGTGRLTIPLARRGLDVVAVEQAAAYVARAAERARAVGVTPELVVGDAFAYVPAPPCRGAFNWWTSFGYLDDDAGNARMLRRAFEALVPGGRFALDFLHAPQILRHFRAEEITRRGDLVLHRASRLELGRGLLHKRWTFTQPDGRVVERASRVRLYMPDQLVALLGSVGFTDVRLVGSTAGEPLDLDSPRCIAIASRP